MQKSYFIHPMRPFETINRGYHQVFQANQLSLGLVVPIESYANSPIPSLSDHLKRAQHAEQLGFKALWLRDVPLQVPAFGDAGQTFDPFTYLGYLAGQTHTIALGIASVALPLHHPIHVAKSAATIDQLSEGRLILGVASGDRLQEYPAMGLDHEQRGALFRAAFAYLRAAAKPFPEVAPTAYGQLTGQADVLPKPFGDKLPLLLTGYSQQSLEWNAAHGDGWMYYPRNSAQQQQLIQRYRQLIPRTQAYSKPFMQPLYIDLQPDKDFRPQPIHLGFRIGVHYLVDYLQQLADIGVNHVALNLRFNQASIPTTLEQLAQHVLPHFHHTSTTA